jgi:hypothetical protein
MSERDVHVMYQINVLLTRFFFGGVGVGWGGIMKFVSLLVQRLIFDRNKTNHIPQRTFLSTDGQHQMLLSNCTFRALRIDVQSVPAK